MQNIKYLSNILAQMNEKRKGNFEVDLPKTDEIYPAAGHIIFGANLERMDDMNTYDPQKAAQVWQRVPQ